MSTIYPKSFHLQWSITERCNLDCKHCYKNQKLIDQELSIDQELNILDKFITQVDDWGLDRRNTRISFTGGEPFVKDGFFKLLEKCNRNRDKFQYGILTNGTFIDEKNIRKIKELGVSYMQISIEGMKKENDKIRGEGIFDNALKSAKLIKRHGISVNFSMTVSEMNLDEVPKLIKLSKNNNIPLAIRRLVPIGNAEKVKDLLLSPQRVRQLWEYIFEINKKAWNGISIGCEDGMAVQDFPDYKPGECSAGYASFTVLPNGDVYPCRRLPIHSGNLIENSFKEVYESKEMASLRDVNNRNDVCYQCSHFKKCKGGAKCIAEAYFNDFRAPDPQCWRLFSELPDKELNWRVSNREKYLDPAWYKNPSEPN